MTNNKPVVRPPFNRSATMDLQKPLYRSSTMDLQKPLYRSSTMDLPKPLNRIATMPKPLNRSAAMNHPIPPHPTTLAPRKPPVIDFPTSPQLILGEEMIHFSHPQHPIVKVNLPDLFTCAGCKEYGSGYRFICQHCNYQLHDFCALAPAALKNHPFHYQHQLSFYSKPVKGGIMKSKCDICGKPTKGYGFRCSACGDFQMHPCCAMLSPEVKFPDVHPHTLKLVPGAASSNSNGDPGFVCGECKRKRSGRVYRCTVCDYHLHAVCAKPMVNGLHANGIRGLEKPSMLGTAARLASQVVIEFIGGLMEGLGEGVGEVLVQSVTRGKVSSSNRY